jgi:hypothetical protein
MKFLAQVASIVGFLVACGSHFAGGPVALTSVALAVSLAGGAANMLLGFRGPEMKP